jgi:DNA-binding CsgD family transcriptional regulator
MLAFETASLEEIIELDTILDKKDFKSLAEYLKNRLEIDDIVYHSPNMPGFSMLNPFLQLTYSDDWNKNYREKGYVHIDPVVKKGMTALLPFDWMSTKTNDGTVLRFLGDAESHKVGNHGLTVPIRDEQYKVDALFSVSKLTSEQSWRKLRKEIAKDVVVFAHYIHAKQIEQANSSKNYDFQLSKRELEVIAWASEGKSYDDIASILSISVSTVQAHLESVRHKADALNTPHAISILFRAGMLK